MKTRLMGMIFVMMLIAGVASAETIKGTVNTATSDSVTVTNKKGKSETVTVNPSTKFKGVSGAADLQSGERVKIDARNQNGSLEAKSIQAKKK